MNIPNIWKKEHNQRKKNVNELFYIQKKKKLSFFLRLNVVK